MGFKQTLNLRRNLSLTKWLNFSRRLVSNYTYLVMHWKHRENNMINCINIDLKCLIDLALRMEFSKLFDSLTQKGNNEYLKFTVPSENLFKLFLFAAWAL